MDLSLPSLTSRVAAVAFLVALVPLAFAAWITVDVVRSDSGDGLDSLGAAIAGWIAVLTFGAASIAAAGVALRDTAPRAGLVLALLGLVGTGALCAAFLAAFLA